jgi:hypothetical protein
MQPVDEGHQRAAIRPRFRFSLASLLGLITVGCLIGGLSFSPVWSSDETILLLTWSLSLALSEYIARRYRRSIWWPLAGSFLATAVAFYVLREQDYWAPSTWSWGEYAWNVWRVWGILLSFFGLASLVALVVVRLLPRVPAATRALVGRLRSTRRRRWIAVAVVSAGIVSLALYLVLPDADWSPVWRARWSSSSLPRVLFSSDGSRFITVEDAGRVTLWDATSGRPWKRFRAQSPAVTGEPNFHAAMLSQNRLALTSGIDDSIAIYELPDGKLRRRLTDEEMRSHEARELRALKGGDQLLVVHRSADLRTVHFSLWDDVTQQWLRHGSYDDAQVYLGGVSSSGRYLGLTERVDLNRIEVTVIDFEAFRVDWETQTDGGGPVIFFDDDRMVAHSTKVFALDGREVDELPGVVVGVLPGSNRLVMVEFQSLVPKTLGSLLEDIAIVHHLRYLDRVRLVIAELNAPRPESQSRWFYGYGTILNGEISPDGRRLVWCDDQGRLLLWELPAISPNRKG